MGDEASLTNLNAGRDKILFYYRRVNCAINNDIRHKIVYYLVVKRGEKMRGFVTFSRE